MVDFVNYPPHYTAYKGLEIIDLTEQMNFNRGNAVKYITRAGLKGKSLKKEIEDLEKAVWYIQREIKRIAWATAEKELDGDNWCWNCDYCLDRCACKKGDSDDTYLRPREFRPGYRTVHRSSQRALDDGRGYGRGSRYGRRRRLRSSYLHSLDLRCF